MMTSLHITNKCNLRCFYCYEDDKDFRKKDFIISPEDMEKRINYLLSINASGIEIIGGEPLLYPVLVEHAFFLINQRVPVVISTNGTINSKYIMELLLQQKPTIAVSLDDPTTTPIFRKGIEYPKVINNALMWKQMCEVIITVTLHPHNIDKALSAYLFYRDKGFKNIHFGVVEEWMTEYHWKKFEESAMSVIDESYKDNDIINISPWNDYYSFIKEIVYDKGVELLQIFNPGELDSKYTQVKKTLYEYYKQRRQQ